MLSQFIEMFGNPVSNNKGWNTKKLKVVAPEYTPQILLFSRLNESLIFTLNEAA
ncbi:hypothetical protein SAMN04487884_12967 [Butyrivibrio fibrisolvens]|uniref:Uncharacterized protein n=1 Tax=Butyrivibrio fibrisolvens TaxID=831 RepID=A0A1H9WEL1_BUTFI|nr:hypothetical protein SAMN04487884_12967 [Butyrivibrio fibrisolvens]